MKEVGQISRQISSYYYQQTTRFFVKMALNDGMGRNEQQLLASPCNHHFPQPATEEKCKIIRQRNLDAQPIVCRPTKFISVLLVLLFRVYERNLTGNLSACSAVALICLTN